MTKRIVSGVFLLIALGALGLILAGALTSGEQLIVRFLTAIIVAALGLYVISDLRLQADDQAAATARAGNASRRLAGESPPPDSTAAYMETVTGKRSAQPADPASVDPAVTDERELAKAGVDGQAKGEPTLKLALTDKAPKPEPAAISNGPILEATPPPPEHTTSPAAGSSNLEATSSEAASTWTPPSATDDVESPYQADLDAAEHWPFNTAAKDEASTPDSVGQEVDELVAIFARKTEQELAQHDAEAAVESKAATESEPTTESEPAVESAKAESKATAEGETKVESADEAPSDVTGEATSGATIGDFLNRGPELVDREVESSTDHEPASTGSDRHEQDRTTESSESANSDQLPKVSYVPPTKLTPTQEAASEPEKTDSIAPIIDLRTAQSAVQAATTTGSGRPVTSVEELEAAIRSGELEVISSLIEQRLLSTEGPITDRDVSTMVYVAFTSSELRKILLAGGTLDSDLSELDLGDVEVFVDPTDEELEAIQESAAMINLRAADLITADSQAL